jgi:hypothetical protein
MKNSWTGRAGQSDMAGAFTLLFLYLGILYSWGVYQAYFVTNNVASSLALSAVGGVQVFMQAIGCLPVCLHPLSLSSCHLCRVTVKLS